MLGHYGAYIPYSRVLRHTPLISAYSLLPSKNELARSCKNLARILHARLARNMSLFLHNLAPILARSCKKCARNAGNYSCSNSCKILHHFLQDIYVQDCARTMQETEGTYRVQVLHARFLQESCTILHDLASSFLLGRWWFFGGS